LAKWTQTPIMPTPAGEGTMFRVLAEQRNVNVIGVGLGGATTNVYSSFDGKFVRTVSANLGMSYSICNVLKEAEMKNIMRWVPFELDEDDISNSLRNKMIRPTTIPNTLEELIVEQAVAREALRLGLAHHRYLARGLRGVQRDMGFHTMFKDTIEEYESYIELIRIDIMCGTGGLLSHAPRRAQSALVLMDGFRPEGVTKLYQDSVFMIPHLGVLSTVHPKAAVEIFEKDCIIQLGTCIAPKGLGKEGESVVTVQTPQETVEVTYGNIKVVPLKKDEKINVKINPAKNFDVGKGIGHSYETQVEGGEVGVIIDARGRPLRMPESADERRNKLMEWFKALDAYDMSVLEKYQKRGN
ncbi:MAG: glutamate mutase L, partial [Candidatus Bathyarchaeota archaeon]